MHTERAMESVRIRRVEVRENIGDSFPRAKQTVRNDEVSVKRVLTVVYPYFNSYIYKTYL